MCRCINLFFRLYSSSSQFPGKTNAVITFPSIVCSDQHSCLMCCASSISSCRCCSCHKYQFCQPHFHFFQPCVLFSTAWFFITLPVCTLSVCQPTSRRLVLSSFILLSAPVGEVRRLCPAVYFPRQKGALQAFVNSAQHWPSFFTIKLRDCWAPANSQQLYKSRQSCFFLSSLFLEF